MRILIAPLLWALAIGIALLVLWRLRRGQRVVLRGKWGPRIIRMVAVILVILGAGVDENSGNRAHAAPDTVLPEKGEALPQSVNERSVSNWLHINTRPNVDEGRAFGDFQSYWSNFKQEFVRLSAIGRPRADELADFRKLVESLPHALQPIVLGDIDAMRGGKPAAPVPVGHLIKALDELESQGYFDHWINAYLWRKSTTLVDGASPKDRIDLFARIHRHARITDSLIRAQAVVKPVMSSPRAWMSKAGPTQWERVEMDAARKGVHAVVKEAAVFFNTTRAGSWDTDAQAAFSLAEGSAVPSLIRAGRKTPVVKGERFRVGRLDVLETPEGDKPVILEHTWLGKFELPAGKVVSVWDLPDWSPNDVRVKLFKATKEALDGSKDAAAELEKVLPLAHPFIRDAVTQLPREKGAARLRMILTQFDDTLMPDLPQFRFKLEKFIEDGNLPDGIDRGRPLSQPPASGKRRDRKE